MFTLWVTQRESSKHACTEITKRAQKWNITWAVHETEATASVMRCYKFPLNLRVRLLMTNKSIEKASQLEFLFSCINKGQGTFSHQGPCFRFHLGGGFPDEPVSLAKSLERVTGSRDNCIYDVDLWKKTQGRVWNVTTVNAIYQACT